MILIFINKSPERYNKSVLFLPAFFSENAGYNWRVAKWVECFAKEGYKVSANEATNNKEFYDLTKNNHSLFLCKYLHRRFWQTVKSRKFETVIVRRELLIFNDYGNLFLEELLLKIHPNAVLDFDDDLSAAKQQPYKVENWKAKIMMENGDKFNETLKSYKYFIVASEFLKKRVLGENKQIAPGNVIVIPTCVDYDKYPSKEYPSTNKVFTFGWIGGDHNYTLLDHLLPYFNKLSTEYKFRLLVIGRTLYKREVDFTIDFIPWSLESEVGSIKEMDVGLMPLQKGAIANGKAGFKLIQYMGLGVPGIASAITVNREIIHHGVDSFLIEDDGEWIQLFKSILENQYDLAKIGESARLKILNDYSFKSFSGEYVNFIKEIA